MCLHEDCQEKPSFRQKIVENNADGHEPLKLNQYNPKTQMNDKVKWLQNKVQQQNAQILSLSNQLKRQTKIKDHTQRLLYQQKQKTSRTNNSNSTTNRHNSSIKADFVNNNLIDSDHNTVKGRKIVHVVDRIRKKNIKVDENTKHSNNCKQIEKDVQGLREVLGHSQNKQASLLRQIQSLKAQSRQKDQQISHSQKQITKIKIDYQLLLKDMCTQQQEIQAIHADTKHVMNRQNQEISRLQTQLAYQFSNSTCHIKENYNSRIAKTQMKRALATHLKDDCVRKKLQFQMLVVLEGVCANISHTSRPLSTARQ